MSAFSTPVTVAAEPVPGVNLVGFLQAELGIGEAARKLGRGLERAGIPVSAITYKRTAARQEHPFEERAAHAPYDTNLICLNPDNLHEFMRDAGADFFAGRYSIGVWFWETSIFPRENLPGFRFVDEIWVSSEYVRDVVSTETELPVLVVPLPIEEPPQTGLSRSDLGLPPEFTFLFSFDFFSVFQRKNPIGLVEAFTRAFAPSEGPVLILKSINGERKPRWLAQLQEAIANRSDIRLLDGYVAADTNSALMAACDCYVSLHRSEGFGLTMAEAMSYGRPVIATAYSGNMEFMDESNSYLVPYGLCQIPTDWAFSPGAEWADPDLDAAAALMRHVYEHPEKARERGEQARRDVLNRLSLARAAEFMSGRLSAIRTSHAFAARSSPHDVRTPILRASSELAKGIGGSLAESSRRASPTSLVRRFLVRALWPYLAAQHRLDSAMLDALLALQRSQDDLRRRLAEHEARPSEEGSQVEHAAALPRTGE